MSVGIYCIKNNTNGKLYIGQSKNIEKRFKSHKYQLETNRHNNSHLQSSFNKYGMSSFEFDILEHCNEYELDEKERHYISYFDTMDNSKGYNLESGGNAYKHRSIETLKKISESKKGKNHPMYGKFGKDHIRYGKSDSIETKLKKSKVRNTTGYFRVCKMTTNSCKQGYRWSYVYYKNGKRALISSVNLDELESKVKSKGLLWFKFD